METATLANAIDWFEIPVGDMNRAQAFYEKLLATALRRETIAGQSLAVFNYAETGVGYRMRSGFDLPPLMFTREEAQALVAAVRVARSRLDEALAGDVETALSKILAVLPAASRAAAESIAVLVPPAALDAATRTRLRVLREATEQRAKVHMRYLDLKGSASERTVRPLGCVYWGEVWTLAAWCETRQGFRNFRIDRITGVDVLDERFRDEPGKTLADLLREVEFDRSGV